MHRTHRTQGIIFADVYRKTDCSIEDWQSTNTRNLVIINFIPNALILQANLTREVILNLLIVYMAHYCDKVMGGSFVMVTGTDDRWIDFKLVLIL